MTKHKEVILFLVEGFSDKEALERIVNALVTEELVLFLVMNGDITSNRTTKRDNVLRRVGEQVKEAMAKYKLLKGDIRQIIHLVDSDGVFIPDNHIKNGGESGFLYTKKEILAGNCEAAKERNERKAKMLEKLTQTGRLFGVPYRVFYMSCNLDHVLYDIQNLKYEEKVAYADAFYENYQGHEKEFLSFICGKEVAVEGEYKETWKFLESDLNSLSRCSNLCLFFTQVTKKL